jgi:hypothetical protein
MKNMNYQFRTLLTALFMVISSMVVFAQFVPVQMTYTHGAWVTEPGWEIIHVPSGTVVNCQNSGSNFLANGYTVTLNLTAGETYRVMAWDSFGDGWNGCALTFNQSGITLFNGGLASGGGFNNFCPGPSSNGVNIGEFTPLVPSDCAIICPGDITVDNDPGTCEANVTVPMPTLDACMTGTVITNDFNGTSNASGIYPIGTTEVEFTAQEPQAIPKKCTMTVTVNILNPLN